MTNQLQISLPPTTHIYICHTRYHAYPWGLRALQWAVSTYIVHQTTPPYQLIHPKAVLHGDRVHIPTWCDTCKHITKSCQLPTCMLQLCWKIEIRARKPPNATLFTPILSLRTPDWYCDHCCTICCDSVREPKFVQYLCLRSRQELLQAVQPERPQCWSVSSCSPSTVGSVLLWQGYWEE